MSLPALVAVAPIGGLLLVQEFRSDFPEPCSSLSMRNESFHIMHITLEEKKLFL